MKQQSRKINRSDIIALFALCISIMALVFSEFPFLKPGNSDLLEMAKSGDPISQMRIANYYYIIGNEENSLYWYKILSERQSIYQSVAKNNTAFLYMANEDKYKEIIPNYYSHILVLFIEAYEQGNSDSRKNIYEMINSTPIAFIKDQYLHAAKICEGYSILEEEEYDPSKWIYQYQDEMIMKHDKWENGGYFKEIKNIDGINYLYIYELDSCRSNAIGDVDLKFIVKVYRRSENKRTVYSYTSPKL